MSKLILLISLIGFISIEVFANPPKKTSGSPLGNKNWANQNTGYIPKPAPIQVPCKAGINCLEKPKSTFQAKSTKGLSGERKVYAECYNRNQGYSGGYQKCLNDNGVFPVNRNINSSDSTQTDARICYVGDPLCDKCLAQSKVAKNNVERRNKVANCIAEEQKKQRAAVAAAKPKAAKPKEKGKSEAADPKPKAVAATCTKQAPHRCTNESDCDAVNGRWDGKACAIASCPVGTTADTTPNNNHMCKCDLDSEYSVERGTEQQCPSMCKSEEHKEYVMLERTCGCVDGYENRMGTCVATTAPESQVAGCIAELQAKVNSCGSAATNAVNRCDPNQESKGSDTISTMQTLLGGVTSAMQAGGAAQNCGMAAALGTTGYYALEELRDTCDSQISSCKSSCSDASSYIAANKQRVYEACRKKQYDELACTINNPFPNAFLEPEWNAEWDKINRGPFEQQIAQMENNISSSNAKCEENGTAMSNREKMSNYMGDMDSAFKSASQCECQLGSGGDCANQVGPADCAANPSLPGCAKAKINCLSASDNSTQCLCFKNPNSDECKGLRNVTNAVRSLNPNLSSFAVGGAGSNSGMATANPTGAGVDTKPFHVGDLSGLGAGDGEVAGASSAGATSDAGSPFGGAGGPGGGGGGGGGGGASGNVNAAGAGEDGDGSAESKIRGMFNVAKGAIGNLFNGKKNGDDKGYTGADGIQRDANGNPMDPKKWRPRGMVRGLAGNDTEIAGKFEDIWKVMNKQYKVQDQKDSFIFGEKN